jgi:tetratricopeptide (TPR) repeat protein
MHHYLFSTLSMFAMAAVAAAFISQGGDSLAMMRHSLPKTEAPNAVQEKGEPLRKVPEAESRTSWAKLHNLGISLAKSGKMQESTGKLWKALSVKPDEVETWLALAGLYQANGDLKKAISIASEYLKRYPKAKDTDKITEYMKYLRSEEKSLASNDKTKYVKGNVKLAEWLDERMPLRVYIHSEELTAADRVFLPVIHSAFDKWTQVSKGKIKFTFVTSPDTSDIECFLTGKSKNLHRTFAAGETRWQLTDGGSLRASVFLLTEINDEPATPSRLYWLTMHEVGHALGLQHSQDPKDIMFISMPIKDEWRSPSVRDQLSLNRLYRSGTQTASR